jgi:3-oxoacyl-[acyl-carrier protein] reductase
VEELFSHRKDGAAIITGAAGGIGKQSARRLARAGCPIFAMDLSAEGLAAMQAELAGEGLTQVHTYACNAAREDAVQAAIAKCLEVYGNIATLVNTAGIYQERRLEEMTLAEWKQTMEVNVDSVFLLCRGVLPAMRANGYGKIINLTSQAGVQGSACHAHYAASKAAIIGLSRSLAKEVAAEHISVNCIAPGIIRTPMTAHYTPEQAASFTRQIPMGHFGDPDEVAKVVEFLASDGSDYLTGQVYNVTGGWLLIS